MCIRDRFYALRLEPVGKLTTFIHPQHDAEVRHRHVVGVDVIRRFHGRTFGSEMCDDLVAVEVEIYPTVRAAAFVTTENVAVKRARCSEVVNRKCEMEEVLHWTDL